MSSPIKAAVAPPVVPEYGGACLDGVVPALMHAPPRPAEWLPEPARDAQQVVLFVLDGLGWEQLQELSDAAPVLSSMTGGPITSVAPSTTAAALTSITTGRAPADHGVIGYRIAVDGDRVLNVLRWRTADGDALHSVPPESIQPHAAFLGQPVPVVTKAEFAGTGFSVAHLTGARLVGWRMPSSIAVEVRRLLFEGERFVYAYYDGIDRIAHAVGFGAHYRAEVAAADRLVADIAAALPPGACLVVTSDHGQVEVGDRLVGLDPGVAAAAKFQSGEGRFRWLHTGADRASEVAAEAARLYGDRAWVRTRAEIEDEGWFGASLAPEVAGRLGDVALVPFAPIAFHDPNDTGALALVCRHGSLTSAEMLVPLVALGSVA